MSSAGRPVPWASWQEWQQVATCFQERERASIQKGLDKVAAWRCRGRVPLGVEITASLLDIQMRDSVSGGQAATAVQAQPADDAALRMHYAMAIIRLVNGISDSAQKGRTAVSVASLSEAAGLPRMLVDVRHEATHNELPSLPLLRTAAHQALAWLRASYWQAQAQQLQACALRCEELLQELLQATPCAKSAGQEAILCSPQARQKQQRSVLLELKTLVPAAAAALLVPPLLRPGLMALPSTLSVAAGPDAATQGDSHYTATTAVAPVDADATQAQAADAAWNASMIMLQQEWPALPALLLCGAVSQLTGGAQAHTPAAAAQAMSWIRLLLRAAGKSSDPVGNSSRKGRGSKKQGFAWQLAQPQLQQLLAHCLRTLCPGSQHLELLDVALLLLELREGFGDKTAMDVAEPEAVKEAEDRQTLLVAQQSCPPQPAALQGSSPVRWQRVDAWTPCAIGAQPCVHDLNGSSFSLDAAWLHAFSPSDAAANAPPGSGDDAAGHDGPAMEDSIPDYFAQFDSVPGTNMAVVSEQIVVTAGLLQLDVDQIAKW